MPIVPIREWVPDASDLANPGAILIRNALPGVNSYKPFPKLVTQTDALDDRPRGAIEEIDASRNVYQYAGDEAKLYVRSGTSWNDVSKVGGYSTGTAERWEFVRWKEKILATNFTDNPQSITFGGANFADMTTDLRFRRIAVIKDFVIAGNTFDATDGAVRDRVRWSAFNNETDWTVSPATLSSFRDLKVGGGVQRIFGGEYGVVLSEKSTFRVTFIGSPNVFQIDEVVPGVGAIAPGASARLGDQIFFWSEHGFIALSGGSTEQFIGAGRVDDFAETDLDESFLERMSAVADPRSGRVYWSYPGAGNVDGLPNKIIAYDKNLNRWGYGEVDTELVWRSGGVATTLEELDALYASVDDIEVSLDSAQWKGTSPLFAGFDPAFKNGNFNGAPLEALIETREVELFPGRKTVLRGFQSLVDSGTTMVEVGTRKSQADTVKYSAKKARRSTGSYPCRVKSRFFRFRMTITGEWKDAIGIQIDDDQVAPADRRG